MAINQKQLMCAAISNTINTVFEQHLPQRTVHNAAADPFLQSIETDLFVSHAPVIVCVIDYNSKKYVHVSKHIKNELALTDEELKEDGIAAALMNVEVNQRNFFIETLYPAIFDVFTQYAPSDEAKDLHITYEALLESASGKYEWYLHQLSVLSCDEKGFPMFGLTFLSNIHQEKKDEVLHFAICMKNPAKPVKLLYRQDYNPHEINHCLSAREVEIAGLLKKGYSTKMIAEALFISENTVATHRKNIIRKLKGN